MPTDELRARSTFNLIDEPWIPVSTGTTTEMVSILDAFRRGGELGTITGDAPLQTMALYRLLWTIAHAALRPVRNPIETWAQLREDESAMATAVETYLNRPEIRSRFDLLHPDQPFYQMVGMKPAGNLEKENGPSLLLAKLIPDLPTGTVSTFSNRTIDSVLSMSYAEAARWVLNIHSGDVNGIHSWMRGQNGSSGGKMYGRPDGASWFCKTGQIVVEGRNLTETILLNLVLGDPISGEPTSGSDDTPVWERPHSNVYVDKECVAVPAGPLSLATWQERRVLLTHDGAAVTAAVYTFGESMAVPTEAMNRDTHTGWNLHEEDSKKTKEPVYKPARHQPSGPVWSGLTAMLAQTDRPAGNNRPLVLDWIAQLQSERIFPRNRHIRIRALGATLDANLAVIKGGIDDSLPLSALAVGSEGAAVAAAIRNGFKMSASALTAMKMLAYEVLLAGGRSPAPDSPSGAKIGASTAPVVTFARDADRLFRSWAPSVADDPEQALADWTEDLRALTLRAGRRVLSDASTRAIFVGRTIGDRTYIAPESHRIFQNKVFSAMPRMDQENQTTEGASA